MASAWERMGPPGGWTWVWLDVWLCVWGMFGIVMRAA